jgi:phosphatidylserine/phosphatidylglycerophosphate/cardiolipin synthase-like enzyme
MSIKIGNIEFFADPLDLGAPDNLENAVITFIDHAQKKLDIAVQELKSQAVGEAIIRARQRKVTVRIVLEQDYFRSSQMQLKPFEPGGEYEENCYHIQSQSYIPQRLSSLLLSLW